MKELRVNARYSQKQLADLCETTQASIGRYETGLAEPPLEKLLWYANFFEVSLDYIFGRTDSPEGKLYENKPKVIEAMTKEDKQLRQFVDMCFDPNSPISERLREVLTEQLKQNNR